MQPQALLAGQSCPRRKDENAATKPRTDASAHGGGAPLGPPACHLSTPEPGQGMSESQQPKVETPRQDAISSCATCGYPRQDAILSPGMQVSDSSCPSNPQVSRTPQTPFSRDTNGPPGERKRTARLQRHACCQRVPRNSSEFPKSAVETPRVRQFCPSHCLGTVRSVCSPSVCSTQVCSSSATNPLRLPEALRPNETIAITRGTARFLRSFPQRKRTARLQRQACCLGESPQLLRFPRVASETPRKSLILLSHCSQTALRGSTLEKLYQEPLLEGSTFEKLYQEPVC